MSHAIRLYQPGGPDVLVWEPVPVAVPGPGQLLVRQTAVGINFIDIYHRTGLYPLPGLPHGLGLEAAGVVVALGPEVTGFEVGDRVAYIGGPPGAYAEERVIPAERTLRLPDAISDTVAGTLLLQGLTAQYLLRTTYRVGPGDTILVHAAAGGTGLLLAQWARALGATVIGTVSSEEKAALAVANGVHHPIIYTRENFGDRVRELTGGAGVPVVYDGVGKTTFYGSLDVLRPRGLLVSFGQASGAIGPVDLGILATKGSLYVTRPTLFNHIASRTDLLQRAEELFSVVLAGTVAIRVGSTYPLSQAADAHRALESRQTTGSIVLIP